MVLIPLQAIHASIVAEHITQIASSQTSGNLCVGASGETLTTGVTTYTTTLQLPAGYKFIMGARWRVETTITGITTIDFGGRRISLPSIRRV